ncbi:uroporphyrinogen-III C-methyltransferase [Aeropyrum camini]|uniref:uroporphyrinogen-III C-methyltransferase n=1 Tax=Aeropyrum camini SY1 = JCM 12091 TaxID=1198449 RepID=U3TEA7_9CREN|nr:uroporphyrinogen-III C-methyltransferase [Aeropyrum camini]BAN89649.1 uroporphyrin-III C-methyltransferase [Aeropyrum camini SY1 = JCM 12091]
MARCQGRVVIIGGGPGDPELITVKGLRALETADAILYDRLAPKGLLENLETRALKIYVGKRPGEGLPQEEINRIMENLACRGMTVARLKGGDPYTYGRGEEECMYLIERGVECIVIPGVPSYVAASALHGVPLTSRGVSSSFAVVPGKEAPGKPDGRRVKLEEIAKSVDTLVILMGASASAEIAERLLKVLPPETPVAIASNVSTPEAETVVTSLEGLRELGINGMVKSPAVIIVGEVVRLRDKLYREA